MNLNYNEIGDFFTCPNGKRLNHAYDEKSKTENALRSYMLEYFVQWYDYRNYELNVELNMNIRQFFLGMDEAECYPITA